MEFEQEVQNYLKLKGKHTAEIYATAFRNFATYYRPKHGVNKVFGHFLDRIFKDFDKPPREQERVAETELTQYIKYLKQKKLKNNPNKTLSNNAIRLYLAAMQDFLKYMHIIVSTEFISDVPAPNGKKENKKHEWEIEQIKQFVDAASTYRDKAIILCMFQSGLGDSEICNLNYGDVKSEFEAGILPICLNLVRQKTEVEFKSFFGRDAVKYLRLYLATRKDLKADSPLFVKERVRGEEKERIRGEERINPSTIQQSFSEIAKGLDFIKQNGNGDYNPARPHSLRAAFNSQLIETIPEVLRDFWMGHDIGVQADAYLTMPTEKMRKLYATAEEFLKIEKSSRDELDEMQKAKGVVASVLEAEVKALEQKVKSLETLYNKLFEMRPEELRLLLQEIDRLLHDRQKAEDKRQFSSS